MAGVSDDWAVAMLAPAARTLLLSLILLDIYLVTAATETEELKENSNDGVVLNSVNDDQTLQKRNGDGHRGTGAKYENSFIKQMERVKLRFRKLTSYDIFRHWMCGEGKLLPVPLLQV